MARVDSFMASSMPGNRGTHPAARTSRCRMQSQPFLLNVSPNSARCMSLRGPDARAWLPQQVWKGPGLPSGASLRHWKPARLPACPPARLPACLTACLPCICLASDAGTNAPLGLTPVIQDLPQHLSVHPPRRRRRQMSLDGQRPRGWIQSVAIQVGYSVS